MIPVGTKLHLGCGSHYLEDWLNVDGLPSMRCDLVIDFFELFERIERPTFIQVYWSHGPEHVYPDRLLPLLRMIRESLLVGGLLTIATIDLQGIYENRFLTSRNGSAWNSALYGETDSTHHPYLSHKQAFTQSSLEGFLIEAGFKTVRRWSLGDYPEIRKLNDYACSCELVSCFAEGMR
jgi:predicted SAM-dependent methyltransferase